MDNNQFYSEMSGSANNSDVIYYAVYESYYTLVFLFAKSLVNDKEEARDIVSDVFEIIWMSRSNFDSVSKMRSFAYKCTRNKCFNHLKQVKRRRSKQSEIVLRITPLEAVELNAAHIELEQDPLHKAISLLDIKYKESIWLFYFADMTCNEIADILQLSVPKVHYRLKRGRVLLKAALYSN
jgi:RNA polymerase sigma factor (sigma-70 family)